MQNPDWTPLERIESKLRDDKARLARLSASVDNYRVDLDRIAREAARKREPVWLEILGGLVVALSAFVIFIGMLLL